MSIKKANISHADGMSFDTPILCDTDGRVLKYFIDADGNLICGHIFNIHVTRIDEDGVIVKIYESEQPAQILLDESSTNAETVYSGWLPTKQLNLDGFEPEHEQTELDFG